MSRDDIQAVVAVDHMRAGGREQSQTLLHGFGVVVSGSVATAAPSPGVLVSDDGRYATAAVGELFNGRHGATVEQLLRHFLENGFSGWEKLNGQFMFALFDRIENRCYLITDRYGFIPAYYLSTSRTLFFGTRIRDVIGMSPASPQLSELGVSELLFFGHHFGSGTLFEGVSCVPPGSILTFDGKRISVQRYWRAVYEPDRALAVDDLAASLSKAVARQSMDGGKLGVLLSGGLDSRIVAHEAVKRNSALGAFTFGTPGAMDVVYASKIAKRLGISHTFMQFDAKDWVRSLPVAAELVEGEADIRHFGSVQFYPRMTEACDTILTGISGDLIMGSMIKKQHIAVLPKEVIADFAFGWSLEHPLERLEALLLPKQRAQLKAMCRAVVGETLHENPNEKAADILTAWNIENRQRRLIFTGPHVDRPMFHVRSPFFDYDLFDCALRIPATDRYGEGLYIKTLWQMMPELKDIPWQKTGFPAHPITRSVGGAFKVITRVKSKLGMGLKPSFVDQGRLLREGFDATQLETLLLRRPRRWHSLIDTDAVRRLIDDHFAKRKNHAVLITKFLTISYAEDALLS